MIGRFNPVAIVVPDLEAAAKQYRKTLGARASDPQPVPEHGVTVVFIELPNRKVELLHPLGERFSIQGFLDKNPPGGINHIWYEIIDIYAARERPKENGARVLDDCEPRIGAHGNPAMGAGASGGRSGRLIPQASEVF